MTWPAPPLAASPGPAADALANWAPGPATGGPAALDAGPIGFATSLAGHAGEVFPSSGVYAAAPTSADIAMLVAVGALLLATAYLSIAEVGLTRLNRSRSEALAEEGHRSGRALRRLVAQPRSFLTPVRFLTVLCQLVQATLVGIVGDRLFGVVGLVVATAVDVVIVFVFGESVPKTWAFLNPERAALLTARPIRLLVRLPPVAWAARLLIAVTNMVVPGKGMEQGPFLTEEELLAIAQRGVDEGVIDAEEQELIESIIEFGDTVVREVMVPRPDMVSVDASFRVADVMEVVLLNGYSRLPVRGEGIDDVIGLVYAKDLMRAERDGHEHERVSTLLRPLHLVPETKRVPHLLREMQREKFHMAIVVDEYGGTAGLVTLEDLIEELVGEIVDEFDVEDPLIEPQPDGGLRVHSRTPLDEVNDLLHAQLPEGDWDSIGGLLYHELGRVPFEGEAVVVNGWRLAAERVQGRRIGRVRIDAVEVEEPPEEAPDDAEAAPEAAGGSDDDADGPAAERKRGRGWLGRGSRDEPEEASPPEPPPVGSPPVGSPPPGSRATGSPPSGSPTAAVRGSPGHSEGPTGG
jgi:CBS domain containing-hemolysin-like protein